MPKPQHRTHSMLERFVANCAWYYHNKSLVFIEPDAMEALMNHRARDSDMTEIVRRCVESAVKSGTFRITLSIVSSFQN